MPTLVVAGIVSLAIVAMVVGDGEDATGPAAADPAGSTVRVDLQRTGRTVPAGFLGLSVEWDSVAKYAGPHGLRAAALGRLLEPIIRSQGPLGLRIGGDTGDEAWWNPQHLPRPPAVLQDVTPATLADIAALARGVHADVTLGLNLALGDPANAVALARAARRELPPGALGTVEIGNEPDLYTHAHTFRVGGHLHRRLRKRASYPTAQYGSDVAGYLAALSAGLGPRVRLSVGGFATRAWWPALPQLLRAWGPHASVVSAHLYAVPNCAAPTPSSAWLMSTEASRKRVASLRPLAALAARRGLPLRLSELNSAACGGRPRWSGTSAAAIWLTDTLFALVRTGFAEADVHTWDHARYAPFVVAGDTVRPRPPLAGMVAFARSAPPGSRLAAVRVRGSGHVRAWATVDRRRTVRIALLAPKAARVRLVAGGRRCRELWVAGRPAATTHCPRGAAGRIALGRRSLAVVTLA